VSQPQPDAKKNNTALYIIAAVVVATIIAGVVYYRGSGETAATSGEKVTEVNVTDLMQKGPLPEMSLGEASAPNTIVEYASATCGHCASFHTDVFPELKTKYVDTGKVRFVFREFPLDNLAVAAFMLARCAGDDRYFPMVGALFETQKTWAVPGTDAKDKLLLIAKQAGISQEQFDKCLADKELFGKIVEVRQRGHEKFGVDSTPSFFVNGKRMQGDHKLADFEAAIEGRPAATPPAGETETPEPSP
jgi:protein-disulfide isomerase